MDTSKGRKVPFQPKAPQQQQQPRREDYVRHPEFKDRIAKEMDGVEFPKDKIPAQFGEWLLKTLAHIPFTALGMPLPFYYELIHSNPEEMTFGLLQKACDIVYNSKPADFGFTSNEISQYHNIIMVIATMKDALSDITDPIRDKVIDALMAADKIKHSGLVTG